MGLNVNRGRKIVGTVRTKDEGNTLRVQLVCPAPEANAQLGGLFFTQSPSFLAHQIAMIESQGITARRPCLASLKSPLTINPLTA